MIYKSYKYTKSGRHEIYMEGSHTMLFMSKCDKRLNTNNAGKVQDNIPCNALSCDPWSLKSLNINIAWNAYNP